MVLFYKPLRHSSMVVACVPLTILLVVVFPKEGELYTMMHECLLPVAQRERWQTLVEEGADGVMVTLTDGKIVQHYINGFSHGRRPDVRCYLQAIEAASYTRKKEHVLIIGFGTGSILETILKLPETGNVTLVELCPSSITNLKKFPALRKMLADKRVNLIVDDARRYLLSRAEKFDLIMLDPLRSTEAYSNNIYSREFFHLLKQRLAEQGVLLVWLDNLQEALPNTVSSVFPYLRVYPYFALAGNDPFQESAETRRRLLSSFPEALGLRLHYPSPIEDQHGKRAQRKRFPINEDYRPVSEYWLGQTLNPFFVAPEPRACPPVN